MDSKKRKLKNTVSLFVSQSNARSSEMNKTGSWRFSLPVYREMQAPCISACPAGIEIPKVELHLSKGEIKKAFEKITWENPFPSTCGRVCFHNCETRCNRGSFDQPVGINSLERFIGDIGLTEEYKLKKRAGENGKKIAIIGSGPAGLSAAYFLSSLGYSCEIFEKESEAGGVMRWGIPSYRLPPDILEKEIDRIKELGVRIHLNKELNFEDFKNLMENFNGVFTGVGLGESVAVNFKGSEYLEDGTLFLKEAKEEKKDLDGIDVAVIGGGNTAIDVARSVVRKGGRATILYRRRIEDMPAFIHEIEAAEDEDVKIMELVSPESVLKESSKYLINLQKMKTDSVSDDGRASVLPIHGERKSFKFDKIISATGSRIKDEWHKPDSSALKLAASVIDLTGSVPVVYGGDITNSDHSVTDAIASGKECAIAMDLFFKGNEKIDEHLNKVRVGKTGISFEIYCGERKRSSKTADFEKINCDYFVKSDKTFRKKMDKEQLLKSFDEVEKTFSYKMASKEAQRCFNCGICNECDNCRIFCPEASVLVTAGKRHILTEFCKGCGVCVTECPRSAMDMEEEKV